MDVQEIFYLNLTFKYILFLFLALFWDWELLLKTNCTEFPMIFMIVSYTLKNFFHDDYKYINKFYRNQ
jgi:hypothetical protein